MSGSFLAMAVALAAGTAAADRALVIGTEAAVQGGLFGLGGAPDTAEALRAAGFEVIEPDGDSAPAFRRALSDFMDGLDREPRAVVHLSGAFVNGAGQGWLLADGAEGAPDLANAADFGLSLHSVLAVAAGLPGAAVVALGEAPDGATPGGGLAAGAGAPEVPQGVTLLRGAPDDVAAFVAGPLLEPGRDLAAAVEGVDGVAAEGFLPRGMALIPAPQDASAQPVADPAALERAAWEAARVQDSRDAYQRYLDRYPQGLFAADARAAMAALADSSEPTARQAEAALDLRLEDRRRIQRQLALLGHDPRGVDGVFGPATRDAIRGFQAAAGFPVTGYLEAPQVARLSLQAELRQAEINRDREAADRAAWARVGSGNDAAGLRRYLKDHPDGLYAAEARKRLDRIEAREAEASKAQDRRDWAKAREVDTQRAYRAYLEAHPKGENAARAKALISEREAAAKDRKAARAAEKKLGLTEQTRLMLERRLAQLGYNPGQVDGKLNSDSRDAIRRYQRDRNLPSTGFVDSRMVRVMLSEAGLSPNGG